MRYLPLEFVTINQVLAQPIYDKKFVEQLFDDGHLNGTRIEALKRLGYYSVYVKEEDKPDIKNSIHHDTLSALYTECSELFLLLQGFTQSMKRNTKLNFSIDQTKRLNASILSLEPIVDQVILVLLKDSSPLIHMYESKSIFLYPVQHAVQTAVFAVKIGLKRNLNMQALRNLFMGALLNDVGYLLIKEFDPFKIGRIYGDQKEDLNSHVRYTYDLISQCETVNNTTRTICMQHHEKEDGTGYPSGLTSEKINPLSKVLSACIAFDALISDRPYRPAYPIHKALKIMTDMVGSSFDSLVIEQLRLTVAPFPLGTIITYNKEVGCVIAYEDKTNMPIIEFANGSKISYNSMGDYVVGLKFKLST